MLLISVDTAEGERIETFRKAEEAARLDFMVHLDGRIISYVGVLDSTALQCGGLLSTVFVGRTVYIVGVSRTHYSFFDCRNKTSLNYAR